MIDLAGRPIKSRIDYAGWSVDMFDSDTKIDKLIDAHGWVGFGIYFYLCQKAYGSDGYFYRWGYADGASTARKMGGGIGSKTVCEVVGYCLQIALFDAGVFDRWGVLTSRGIQRRYCVAASERKNKIVAAEYWLLSDEESAGFIKCTINPNVSAENPNLSTNNSIYHQDNSIIRGKVKESKVKYSTGTSAGACVYPKPDQNWVRVINAYEANIGLLPTGKAFENLLSYYGDLGADVIVYAIELTNVAQPDRPKPYLAKLLASWAERGINTLQKAQADSAEHKRRSQPQPQREDDRPEIRPEQWLG